MDITQPANEGIQAIILAGGKGSRLAPLTEDTPKPMLKIMGKTVLEHVLDRVSKYGIKNASVTTMYLPWQIELIGTSYNGMNISYIREKSPLGTAGAVKNAYDGKSGTVIVMSGDGVCDFDLNEAIKFHYEKNAAATIVTYKTENPLEYGVVLTSSDGRVTRIEEKPPWSRVTSGNINTGIYILNKEVLNAIPDAKEFDFAKQLFPLLLAQKRDVFAFEGKGNWFDIGNLDEYFAASCAALDGKINGIENDGLSSEELKEKNVDFDYPVYVSKKAVLGKNVKLGAYTFIGEGSVISDGCDIEMSIIADNVSLGMGCGIYGTLIGRNCRFGENCVTEEGCAVGAGCETDDSVILPKYSFIHSSSHLTGKDFLAKRQNRKESPLFSDDGLVFDITRVPLQLIVKIGQGVAAVASAKKSPGSTRIGIMYDGGDACRRIAEALVCAVESSGVRSYAFDSGFEAVSRYVASRFITDAVLYIKRTDKGEGCIRIFTSTGLSAPFSFEKELTNLIYGAENDTTPDRYYRADRFSSIWTLYYNDLVKKTQETFGKNALSGFKAYFEAEGEITAYSPAYTAICAITELGGEILREKQADAPSFAINRDGLYLECNSAGKKIDDYHINAILIDNLAENVKVLYLDSEYPDIYKSIIKKKNTSFMEYAKDTGIENVKSTEEMQNQLWLNDGVYKCLYLSAIINTKGKRADELLKNIPDFEMYTGTFDGNTNRASVMHKLSEISVQSTKNTGSSNREGVKLVLANGSITVIPGKAAGFKIISEATSTEAAKELWEKAKEYLK